MEFAQTTNTHPPPLVDSTLTPGRQGSKEGKKGGVWKMCHNGVGITEKWPGSSNNPESLEATQTTHWQSRKLDDHRPVPDFPRPPYAR